MSNTKYIRPMSFFGTLGTMYRLYFKIMVPILLLNIILVAMSWWVLIVGAFVGPVLMMTSNAILGKPLKVLDSFRRGIFSVSFLKIAIASIGYIAFIFIISVVFGMVLSGGSGNLSDAAINSLIVFMLYAYVILVPIWIFVPMIMLLEKKGLRASIKRSFQILRRNFTRILQMDIFITVIFAVMVRLLSSILGADASTRLGATIIAFFLPLLTGFSSLPYVFVYYEYRARRENYNEELLTQELGYEPIEEMLTA